MPRNAFIICVSVYPHLAAINQLPSAFHDHGLIESTLYANGYSIGVGRTHHNPVNSADLYDHLSNFFAALKENDDAVVFLSGHGEVRSEGFEFILPEFRKKAWRHARQRMVIPQYDLEDMAQESSARFVVFVVDACRENSYEVHSRHSPRTPRSGNCHVLWMFGCAYNQRCYAPPGGDDPSYFTKAFATVANPGHPAVTLYGCMVDGQPILTASLPAPIEQSFTAVGIPATIPPSYPPFYVWELFDGPIPPASAVSPTLLSGTPSSSATPDRGTATPAADQPDEQSANLTPPFPPANDMATIQGDVTLPPRDRVSPVVRAADVTGAVIAKIGIDPAIVGRKQHAKLLWAVRTLANVKN